MLRNEAVCAIPLWINGRASLKVTQVFHDVRNPVTGRVLRRVPLCGLEDFQEALQSARGGRNAWLGLGRPGRLALLVALGDALSALSGHFAAMIAEETGTSCAQADHEIACAVSLLREPNVLSVPGVAVVSGAPKSFSSLAGQAASALAGGATVIVCPAPESPTALFALAELSGRCGFPPGVFNVVYPRAEVVAGMVASADVAVLP